MPLPELEGRRVKRIIDRWNERVPPHARPELWYTQRSRGNTVTLVENRPYFLDATQTTEHPFARFKYDPSSGKWSLWCRDRNQRWHPYPDFQAVTLEAAVAEVERDPTGIFLG